MVPTKVVSQRVRDERADIPKITITKLNLENTMRKELAGHLNVSGGASHYGRRDRRRKPVRK
ncbi:hypothetical protein [Ferrithrix thermotolerans]|uniref:hypothetical protein n=1 Tax=Ferrithrix thermotolerans TaxID=209649 RepID=UPI000934BA77|nr:hypothetical protein [Ferrithrix thermotolerans]